MPSETSTESTALQHAPTTTADEFPIRICVLDDHPIIGAHIQTLLRPYRDLQVAHVSKTATEAQKYLTDNPCDLLILDFLLPDERDDGAALIKRLRRKHPHLAIVVLSAGNTKHVRHTAFRCRANAHVAKSEMLGNLPTLLRQACNDPEAFFYLEGGQVLSGVPEISEEELTVSEIEVIRRLAMGLSVGQLAEQLMRSKKTVSSHKRRAMKKLDIDNDVALALYLQKHRESLV